MSLEKKIKEENNKIIIGNEKELTRKFDSIIKTTIAGLAGYALTATIIGYAIAEKSTETEKSINITTIEPYIGIGIIAAAVAYEILNPRRKKRIEEDPFFGKIYETYNRITDYFKR